MEANKGISGRILFVILEVIVLIVAVVLVVKVAGMANDWSESNAVAGSAYKLTEAINRVSEERDPNYNETVTIRVPQSGVGISEAGGSIPVVGSLLGGGADPKWVIYYGNYEHGRGDSDTLIHILARAGGDALDAVEVVGGALTEDHYIRDCERSKGKVCYGFFERDIRPEASNLKLEHPGMVEDFWILSPCHANITVYYSGGSFPQVELCYKDDTKPGYDYNYCHGSYLGTWGQVGDLLSIFTGGLGGSLNTGWPSDEYTIWNHHPAEQKEC